MIIDIGMKKERNWIGVLCLSLMIMTGCGDKKTGNEVLRKVNIEENGAVQSQKNGIWFL